MKKFLTVFVSLLLLATFAAASSVLHVAIPTTATTEFFGIAKQVTFGGIHFQLGALYKANDYLSFALPTGWVWKTPTAQFFLVGATGAPCTYRADVNANGIQDWAYFDGGFNSNFIRFRVFDYAQPLGGLNGPRIGWWSAGTWWYLSTSAGAGGVTTNAQVNQFSALSAAPPITGSVAGTSYYVTPTSSDAVSMLPFDPVGTTDRFLRVYTEFYMDMTVPDFTPRTDIIDVAQSRLFFAEAVGRTYSTATQRIRRNNATYQVLLGAGDVFKHTYTGLMGQIQKFNVYGVNSTAIDVLNGIGYLNAGTGAFSIDLVNNRVYVTGTQQIDDRILKLGIDFVAGSGNWYGHNIMVLTTTGYTWYTNGTNFRAAFFSTAEQDGYYSSFRFVNQTAVAAKVFAEVWLDDAPLVSSTLKDLALVNALWTVPANGKLSITASDVVRGVGWTPSLTQDAAGKWKGRVKFTIWAPAEPTYAIMLQIAGGHQTALFLQKMPGAGAGWWEY